jgi:hypothetical protein
MSPSYLCYSSEAIYSTICGRIVGSGYVIKKHDEAGKELIVMRRSFPFINRKFNIKVISVNESVCNISVWEFGIKHVYTERANNLGSLLLAFF